MKDQHQLSPKEYIKTKARKLPIFACYINENWKEDGMAIIYVIRKHTVEKYTFGIYIVDLFALGTKDCYCRFSNDKQQLDDLLYKGDKHIMHEVDYVLVHNIIYGANAFAEDHGFKISKEFELAQYMLEEDTEDIELMEIEFGKDGKPLLIVKGD